MTVPIHVDSTGDRHFPATAAIATFVVILLAVAGLTLFETGSDGGGSSNSDLRTSEVEPFSPEKARAAGARAATPAVIYGDRFGRLGPRTTETGAGVGSSDPYGYLGPNPNEATATGDRYGYLGPSPDEAAAQASPYRIPASEWALPDVNEIRSFGPSPEATFWAIDAPEALKAQAVQESLSDWVVDYRKATEILEGIMTRQAAPDVTDCTYLGTCAPEAPTEPDVVNCSYWGICGPETPTAEPANPNAGSQVQ